MGKKGIIESIMAGAETITRDVFVARFANLENGELLNSSGLRMWLV
jgi:hypothetical protein